MSGESDDPQHHDKRDFDLSRNRPSAQHRKCRDDAPDTGHQDQKGLEFRQEKMK